MGAGGHLWGSRFQSGGKGLGNMGARLGGHPMVGSSSSQNRKREARGQSVVRGLGDQWAKVGGGN